MVSAPSCLVSTSTVVRGGFMNSPGESPLIEITDTSSGTRIPRWARAFNIPIAMGSLEAAKASGSFSPLSSHLNIIRQPFSAPWAPYTDSRHTRPLSPARFKNTCRLLYLGRISGVSSPPK